MRGTQGGTTEAPTKARGLGKESYCGYFEIAH